MRSRGLHILLVLAVCLAVYWPMLGVAGFGSSEGHRVGPAWEMLDTGDWEHLRLFGLTYLRKPPGMPWAIAVSSSILGQTEFAARAVSALASTLMALIALWFTNRWLGPPWGLAAGLAQALSPLFITIGRTAEIDPLNAFATQIAAFALLSLLAPTRVPNAQCLLPKSPLLFTLGLVLAGTVKGPASAPVFLAIALAACLQARSLAPLGNRRLGASVLVACAFLAAFTLWFAGVNAAPDAVTQDFSEFTWSLSRLTGTLMLLPKSFLAAIPTSMAIIVLVVSQRGPVDSREAAHLPMAGMLALSWLLAVLILILTGSSNPRYAMPAGVVLAPLAAWALRACWQARDTSFLARLAMLGHPVVPAVVLLGITLAWIPLEARRPRFQEGREAGAAIAAALPSGAIVWANDFVEARPDALLYAVAAAHREARTITPRWNKQALLVGELPPIDPGRPVFLLLRDDAESQELSRYHDRAELRPVASGRLAKYEWALLRVEADGVASPGPPPRPAP